MLVSCFVFILSSSICNAAPPNPNADQQVLSLKDAEPPPLPQPSLRPVHGFVSLGDSYPAGIGTGRLDDIGLTTSEGDDRRRGAHAYPELIRRDLDGVAWERRPGFSIVVTGYARFFNDEAPGCDAVSLGVWYGAYDRADTWFFLVGGPDNARDETTGPPNGTGGDPEKMRYRGQTAGSVTAFFPSGGPRDLPGEGRGESGLG